MKSKHPEAAQAIRKWISERNLRTGASLPSALALANEIGFGRMPTTLACNMLISAGLLTRNGYKLSVGVETSVRPTISGEIHVVSYSEWFSRAAGRILAERGVKHRLVELSHTNHKNPRPTLRKIFARKPDGVILQMPEWIEGLESVLDREKIPMVICADAAPADLQHSSAGRDLRRGAEKAVRYLHRIGHREIAFVAFNADFPFFLHLTERELADSYRAVCLKLGLNRSAKAIWKLIYPEAAMREALLRQRKRHPEVTAIIAPQDAAALAAKIFDVPGEISVVSFIGYWENSRVSPTTLELHDADHCIALWACTEMISQIQAVESGRPKPMARHALFVPDVVVRESTRALARGEIREGERPLEPRLIPQYSSNPWESWSKTYAYLKKSRTQNWRQLDLSKLANHSMTREHGWLGGDPLLHFSPGLRSIHGVPFEVIEENRNGGRTVVTFRSPHTHTAEKKELPARVKLPVGGPVKALYFLHGCGYAQPMAFAEYRIHFEKGNAARIPLIPIGPAIPMASRRLGKLKPNLQDWWTGYEQRDFPHAKYVTVFNQADPQEYERALYTLEWINPRPNEELSHIEVRVDPRAGPALALIAVTALVRTVRLVSPPSCS